MLLDLYFKTEQKIPNEFITKTLNFSNTHPNNLSVKANKHIQDTAEAWYLTQSIPKEHILSCLRYENNDK